MIESMLALIAVCLPRVHHLFRKVSLESIIHSIRSITSLASGSSGSPGLSRARPSFDAVNGAPERNDSTASHAKMVADHLKHQSVESYAMKDLPKKSRDPMLPRDKILVNSTPTQSHDMV